MVNLSKLTTLVIAQDIDLKPDHLANQADRIQLASVKHLFVRDVDHFNIVKYQAKSAEELQIDGRALCETIAAIFPNLEQVHFYSSALRTRLIEPHLGLFHGCESRCFVSF